MRKLLALVFMSACVATPASSPEPAMTVAAYLSQHGITNLRVNHPMASGFKQWIWRDRGLVEVDATRRDSECYFFADATIDGNVAAVALRTCDAAGQRELSGVAFTSERSFEVIDTGRGIEFHEVAREPSSCGVGEIDSPQVADDGTGLQTVESRRGLQTAESRTGLAAAETTKEFAISSGEPRFIEVVVARDVQLHDGIVAGGYSPDPVMAVHAAAALYDRTGFADRLLPVLVGIIDADEENPWGNTSMYLGEARAGQYLDNINAWISDNQASLLQFDELTMLSGYDFEGSTVGLATVEGACDKDLSASVIQALDKDASVAQTLAHELGHTLGMSHDGSGNACPPSGFVMTAVYDPEGVFPTEFSACSVLYTDDFLASPASACIALESASAYPEPLCGDGKIEGDERCDCGPLGCSGRNPCCNDHCMLKAGATCAPDDPCCDVRTCAPVISGTVCREAQSDCDVAEYCTDGRCPSDQVMPSGDACSDGTWDGACYLGQCVTRGGQCDAIEPRYYFDDPTYDQMCTTDGDCGWIECVNQGECVYTEDTTWDGTACGAGKQCLDGACVASSTLLGADGCADPNGCVDVGPEPDAGMTIPDSTPDSGMPDAGDIDSPSDKPAPTHHMTASSAGGCNAAHASPVWSVLFVGLFFHRRG